MNDSLQTYDSRQRLAHWADIVERCRSSKMTVHSWCAQEGISEKRYYYWQRKVYDAAREEIPEFIEVPQGTVRSAAAAEITVNGINARIHNGADAATIQNLIQAMKTC